jgi:hypothetical protein
MQDTGSPRKVDLGLVNLLAFFPIEGQLNYSFKSELLFEGQQHQIIIAPVAVGRWIMLGGQGLEPCGTYPDVDVGWTAVVSRRRMTLKPVFSFVTRIYGGPVVVIISPVGAGKPELNPGAGDRTAGGG